MSSGSANVQSLQSPHAALRAGARGELARRLVLLGLASGVAAATALGCSSTQECTLVACESTALVRMRAAVAPADLATATISACRGEGPSAGCSTGRISIIPSAPNDRLEFALTGAVNVKGFVSSPDATKGFLLELVYNLDGVSSKEGDLYEVKVTVNTATSASLSERATYTLTQPNGADCPPVCRNALIDKS